MYYNKNKGAKGGNWNINTNCKKTGPKTRIRIRYP